MRYVLLILLALPVFAQDTADPATEVRASIDQLFDGMRAGDSLMVRQVFHPEARLQTTGTRDGQTFMQLADIEQFIAAIGSPRDEVWDEQIENVIIQVDGPLASAWMDYAFYVGERQSHCGANAMQFFHTGERWQLVNIMDVRRPCA